MHKRAEQAREATRVLSEEASADWVSDAGDSPLALMQKEIKPPTPIFSFCKTRNYSDIMLPNIIEGDVFVRPQAKRAFRPDSRAGKLQAQTLCKPNS